MSIEDQIRLKLQKKAKSMEFPRELDQHIRKTFEQHSKRKSPNIVGTKKWIYAAVIVTLFLIPTSVFAYNLLSDNLYGSFEQLKKKIVTATMEQYMVLGMKLQGAQKELGQEEYEKFEQLLRKIAAAKVEYGDTNGNINFEQVPPHVLAAQKKVLSEVQPYFDKLNDDKSSRDILTSQEYESFINALMTYETIKAKTGLTENEGPIEPEVLPSELRSEFIQARKILNDVYQRQSDE